MRLLTMRLFPLLPQALRCLSSVLAGPLRIAVFAAAVSLARGQHAALYVSTEGDDAWSGRIAGPNPDRADGPFATLERARNAIREMKQSGPLPVGGVTVWVREGTYELGDTFRLGPQDSGTEDAPVVYRARPGERVILTGGRSITGFVPHDGAVLKAYVKALGLEGTYFRQLLYNGRRQILARYPNFDPENPHGGGFAYVDGQPLNMYRKLPGGENVRAIHCKPRDVRRWAHPELGEVIIFPRYNWNNVSAPLASADPDKGTITLAKDIADPEHPQSRSIRPLDRYYVRNLPEELDSPGEWFLDKDTWTLYFWPPGPIAGAAVRAPVLETLVDIGPNAHWITLRGFTIQGCDGIAVKVRDSENCIIAGNTIHDTGGRLGWFAAVTVSGGRNCGVVGNDIYEVCNYGIRLSSSRAARDTLEPTGHYADNNYLHHIGVLNGHGCGIAISGVGLRVSHNLIHDTTRCGIFGGGNDCVVEYNHIRHVNLETEDTAGYYVGGNWHIRGHIIRYNYVHDVLGYGRKGDTWSSPHYAWGIYLDDDHSGAHVYGNIVARVPKGGSHVHAGRDNLLENNIFVDNAQQQMQFSGHAADHWVLGRHLDAFKKAMALPAYQKAYPELVDVDLNTIWHMAGNVFRRNILCYRGPDSKLYQCSVRDGMDLRNNTCDENLVWHYGMPVIVGQWGMKDTPAQLTWEQWQEKGFDRQSVVADPLFVDPDNDDYRLKPESPALKLGFEPIPVDRIGPYASALRASWPIVEADGVRENPLRPVKVDLPEEPTRSVPRAPVPVAARAPVVDGTADGGEWPGEALSVAQQTTGTPIQTPPCRLRVCHDRKNLYVAITVPVKDVDALRTGTKWGDDDAAEVCFQDRSAEEPGPIFVIHGFAEGRHESVVEAGASAEAAATVGDAVTFAARRRPESWTGEWCIPLKAADIAYKPGLKLGFNVGVRRTEADEWIQWCGSGATWRLSRAGVLVLE